MANTHYQNKRKFHIVYQVTNLINGKIYIGCHSTDNVNDDYYGSGTNISRAIKKYGKNSFKKEILHIFETPEEMLLKEKEMVTAEFIKREDVYNIVEGGYGGYNKGATGLRHLHRADTNERCAVHPSAVEKMLQEGWILGRNISSTTNTIWIYKKEKKKMISMNELNQYLANGWSKGLPKSPTAGKVWIHNPVTGEYTLCKKEELENKLTTGWIKKKWAPIKKGAIWINNGVENLRIAAEDFDSYISRGWKKGMLTARWN